MAVSLCMKSLLNTCICWRIRSNLHAVDECVWLASTAITVTWLLRLEVEPEKIDVTLRAGSEKQTVLTVVNAGKAPMNFQ